ncbi:Uncharacterised protein [Mycobacteroides abscessus subsp. abscessus]|nr:Uncharacterised protein [Mycobacteroides abscessus subsp. abscessus]
MALRATERGEFSFVDAEANDQVAQQNHALCRPFDG